MRAKARVPSTGRLAWVPFCWSTARRLSGCPGVGIGPPRPRTRQSPSQPPSCSCSHPPWRRSLKPPATPTPAPSPTPQQLLARRLFHPLTSSPRAFRPGSPDGDTLLPGFCCSPAFATPSSNRHNLTYRSPPGRPYQEALPDLPYLRLHVSPPASLMHTFSAPHLPTP